MQAAELFNYDPLDLKRPTFRLVRLVKSNYGFIECELTEAAFDWRDNIISYEALSYTWGCLDLTHSIQMSGRRHMVTENLYHALQHLRRSNRDRVLWVDSLCIDQSNPEEQGHQVQQMRNIYRQAEQVIFWLGQATYETHVVFDMLQDLYKRTVELGRKIVDDDWMSLWYKTQVKYPTEIRNLEEVQYSGLQDLLSRPWFQRTWILQEVANSRSATVCCGARSVLARIFAHVPALCNIIPNSQCQAVLDIMPGPFRERSWWSKKHDLYTLLVKFRHSEAQRSTETTRQDLCFTWNIF